MSMLSINTNVASQNAQRNLSTSQSSLQTSMQRLSSGLRINSAKDDASSLAIAERMNSQVRGNTVAMRNANDAISLTQTADGALGKITDALQRMRELAVQGANNTNTTSDFTNLQTEYTALSSEITRVVADTNFNGYGLFNSGTAASFQIGANNNSNEQLDVAITDLVNDASVTGATGVTMTDQASARGAIDSIDTAIAKISEQRTNFGAAQNRLEAVVSNLQVATENVTTARGRIMDADFATESANLSRANILQQAGMAMVSQANQAPQQVMKLLQ